MAPTVREPSLCLAALLLVHHIRFLLEKGSVIVKCPLVQHRDLLQMAVCCRRFKFVRGISITGSLLGIIADKEKTVSALTGVNTMDNNFDS